VQRILATFFEPYGLHILAVGIGRFELPEDVIGQRIQNWQAEWRRRIHVQEASANAVVLKKLKHARARTQMELVAELTRNIESMHLAGGVNLAEIVTLRMIEALDEALSNKTVQDVTPENVLANLHHLRHWLRDQQQAPEDRPPGLNPGQRNANETV
jgi:hypothetical protein